ncbi:hypothetical protein L1049_020844 [Liquidambar formosana]|uniref:Bromo domain-containing protein n=1 Tax=Liquidambar formosana TaxID=63359 RepID=A0AAP0S836_LIQFO
MALNSHWGRLASENAVVLGTCSDVKLCWIRVGGLFAWESTVVLGTLSNPLECHVISRSECVLCSRAGHTERRMDGHDSISSRRFVHSLWVFRVYPVVVRDLGLGGFDSSIGGQSGLLFSFPLFFVLLSPAVRKEGERQIPRGKILFQLPDYLDVITHPMDFAMVRKKLGNRSYSTLEQFEVEEFTSKGFDCLSPMHMSGILLISCKRYIGVLGMVKSQK